ncbi:hypothetical protein [Nocardioides solisilvae]|uniref:hypothetical protein n=1 Tax=Nocardioides solisilvae TaxID=1542435 RepID=UPI0013A56EA5|nr:hypothetical protein [Nocardioides solisilvae]
MSERGLVVHQGSLTDMETALAEATTAIRDHLTGILDQVNAQTTAWTEETPSRVAQQAHEQRLRDGIEALTQALDSVRGAVATHRETAREAELENVALIG